MSGSLGVSSWETTPQLRSRGDLKARLPNRGEKQGVSPESSGLLEKLVQKKRREGGLAESHDLETESDRWLRKATHAGTGAGEKSVPIESSQRLAWIQRILKLFQDCTPGSHTPRVLSLTFLESPP